MLPLCTVRVKCVSVMLYIAHTPGRRDDVTYAFGIFGCFWVSFSTDSGCVPCFSTPGRLVCALSLVRVLILQTLASAVACVVPLSVPRTVPVNI